MFSKKERLTRAAFTEYFKTGKRLHSDVATLIYQPCPTTHVAVVVGKKVLKKAHERNAARRRIYGVLYRTLKKSNQTGVYIFLTKPTFTSLTKKQQQEAVQNLLKRITLSK
tara:strand:- start:200 stop:532 length:333 start_codon:yes stop_codon:yes gene_type:complete